MAGICGIALSQREGLIDPEDLSSMTQGLPIAASYKGEIVYFGRVGMGIQPFPGRISGTASLELHEEPLVLAFHGNLYNWRELQLSAGKDSDPKAIHALLSLYQEHGIQFLQRLRGEFALALWDGLEQICYVATDRFRVHPLFYYRDHNRLVFASRINALLGCPFVTRNIHPESAVNIVGSSMIPTPRTIFRDIYKLPPGCLLTYRQGESRITSYWDINFREPSARSERELARELKTQFREAVAVRFGGDDNSKRIGTFLSGGVDSSTVTGVLSQLAQRPIKSFSIGFDEQPFNEIQYARIAARAFAAKHHEYFVTPADVYDIIPVLLDSFDEPFANASAIPTYFCAKVAHEHDVDVLYAGDGGDELFAGNERYASQRLFDYYYRIPEWLREAMVQPLVFGLAGSLEWQLFVKGAKYIRRANIPYPDRLSSYGLFKILPLAELLDDRFLTMLGKDCDPYASVESYYFQAPAQTELDRQLYIDLKLTISDNDLFKVSRMTEAAGVAVRYPFLDHHLAEFAATVPAKIKMRGRQLRSFFKKAYADLLPQEVRAKQKHGFGLPIPIWLRTDKRLNEMMQDLVLSPRSMQRGYFRRKTVEDLVQRHKTDESSFYGTILWNLMILELWHRKYANSDPGNEKAVPLVRHRSTPVSNASGHSLNE
jgi:asparagine synthase (glutamine-hydrolysing)